MHRLILLGIPRLQAYPFIKSLVTQANGFVFFGSEIGMLLLWSRR
jgi:hypothetical protein